MACIIYGTVVNIVICTVVNIVKAHILQHKVETDIDWIARNLSVILFGLKNLNNLFVKRSENKLVV